MINRAIEIKECPNAEQRITAAGDAHIHQARRIGDSDWLNVTRIWGNIRPPFQFGKSWQDHVAVNKRRVLHG